MATIYGLDPRQFAFRIVRPLLKDIGLGSNAAERLVLGTAMKESLLRYMQQIRGPAIGVYQMEAPTFKDIRENFLARALEIRRRVDAWAIGTPDAQEMEGNLYFATAMCRAHYRRFSEDLPRQNDALGMATYWKRYYNTSLGKGTVEEALPHFQLAIDIFTKGDSA